MSYKSRLDFLLHITGYFHGHYEPDAGGPEGPIGQILSSLAIRAWASHIEDAEVRGQIIAATDKVIAKHAQGAAKSL